MTSQHYLSQAIAAIFSIDTMVPPIATVPLKMHPKVGKIFPAILLATIAGKAITVTRKSTTARLMMKTFPRFFKCFSRRIAPIISRLPIIPAMPSKKMVTAQNIVYGVMMITQLQQFSIFSLSEFLYIHTQHCQ